MQNTCSKTNRRNDCMQLSKLLRKKTSQNISMRLRAKWNPGWQSHVVYTTGERRGPFSFSLHMGHCIVMGEALLVVVIPQEAPKIGTYSHFRMFYLTRPRACRTCLSLRSKMLKQRTRQRGAATCHVWCHRTPKKRPCRKTNLDIGSKGYKWHKWHHVALLCFMEELRKKTKKKQSTESTVKYSMAQLKSGWFNILL